MLIAKKELFASGSIKYCGTISTVMKWLASYSNRNTSFERIMAISSGTGSRSRADGR